MPRGEDGLFVWDFTFVDDATGTPRVPFDPARFDARFDDAATGLNDIPRQVDPDTDPSTVLSASIMEQDGILYINVLNSAGHRSWRDISTVGITDSAGFISQFQLDSAIEDLDGGAPTGLNTFIEVAAALNNNPNFGADTVAQLALKSAVNHTHELSDINGLQETITNLSQSAFDPTGDFTTEVHGVVSDYGGIGVSGVFSNESLADPRASLSTSATTTIDYGGIT